jgi:hypothetical protein
MSILAGTLTITALHLLRWRSLRGERAIASLEQTGLASTPSIFERGLHRYYQLSPWRVSSRIPATESALSYSSQSRIGNTSRATREPLHARVASSPAAGPHTVALSAHLCSGPSQGEPASVRQYRSAFRSLSSACASVSRSSTSACACCGSRLGQRRTSIVRLVLPIAI